MAPFTAPGMPLATSTTHLQASRIPLLRPPIIWEPIWVSAPERPDSAPVIWPGRPFRAPEIWVPRPPSTLVTLDRAPFTIPATVLDMPDRAPTIWPGSPLIVLTTSVIIRPTVRG